MGSPDTNFRYTTRDFFDFSQNFDIFDIVASRKARACSKKASPASGLG